MTMPFIPPIVTPLLQMVKDLTAALNETRQYLGLPPIDAQQLIDKAYAETAQPGPTGPTGQTGQTRQTDIIVDPLETDKPAATPDGEYTARLVDRDKSGKPCFDPAKFGSNGIFKITIAGGKATFTIKSPLSDAERDDWDTLGAPDVCDGKYQPFLSDDPITDKPGEAAYSDGVWVVTSPAELS